MAGIQDRLHAAQALAEAAEARYESTENVHVAIQRRT